MHVNEWTYSRIPNWEAKSVAVLERAKHDGFRPLPSQTQQHGDTNAHCWIHSTELSPNKNSTVLLLLHTNKSMHLSIRLQNSKQCICLYLCSLTTSLHHIVIDHQSEHKLVWICCQHCCNFRTMQLTGRTVMDWHDTVKNIMQLKHGPALCCQHYQWVVQNDKWPQVLSTQVLHMSAANKYSGTIFKGL